MVKSLSLSSIQMLLLKFLLESVHQLTVFEFAKVTFAPFTVAVPVFVVVASVIVVPLKVLIVMVESA